MKLIKDNAIIWFTLFAISTFVCFALIGLLAFVQYIYDHYLFIWLSISLVPPTVYVGYNLLMKWIGKIHK